MDTSTLFRTDTNITFPGVSAAQYGELLKELSVDFGISSEQIAEAASYSWSMVIRVALGLTASGAHLTAILTDSLAGCCAAATVRHLTNAGTNCSVIILGANKERSPQLSRQLLPLERTEIPLETWETPEQAQNLSERLEDYHAVICGLYHHDSEAACSTLEATIVETLCDQLNESQAPVHCLQLPTGVDANLGTRRGKPLFASSTLSLGLALEGLHSGHEFAGRHYLCDISFPPQLYKQTAPNLGGLFAEQPVLQIFPEN